MRGKLCIWLLGPLLSAGCWDAGAEFILPRGPETETADDDDPDGSGEDDDTAKGGDDDPDDDSADNDSDPENPPDGNASDETAPTIEIPASLANATFGPQNDLSVIGTAQDNVAVVAVFVQFDSLPEMNATGTNTWNVVIDAALLSHGEHTLNARAVDGAGNVGTATKRTFNVDAQGPTAVLSNTPTAVTASPGVGVTVGGNDVVMYRYKIDNSAWSSDRDSATPLVVNPGEGNHTLTVLGIDSYDNVQSEANATTYTWRIDQSAPVLIGMLPATDGLIGKTDVITMIFDEPVEASADDVDSLLGTAVVSSDGNVVTIAPATEWSSWFSDSISVEDQAGNSEFYISLSYNVVDGIVYVSTSGSDTGTGTSASPFRTIQRAIVASNAYGVSLYRGIAVAEGNYTVNGSVDETNATNAMIYGGYSSDWLTRDTSRTTSLRDESGGGASYAALKCGGTGAHLNIDGLTIYSAAPVGPAHAVILESNCVALLDTSTVVVGLGSGADASALKVGAASVTVQGATVTGNSGWAIHVRWQAGLRASAGRISGSTSGSLGSVKIESGGSAIIYNSLLGGGINASGPGGLLLLGNTMSGNGGNAIYDTQSYGRVQNNLIFGFDYGIYQTYTNAFSVVRNNGFATNCAFLDWASGQMKSYCSTTAMDGNLTFADGNVAFAPETTLADINGTDGLPITVVDNDWRLSASATCEVRQGGRSTQEDNTTWIYPGDRDYSGIPRTLPAACGPTNIGADGWSMGAWESD